MSIAQPSRGETASRTSAARRDRRHVLGRLGEDIAARHLTRLGFSILARNARTRHGEIDLIAFDGKALVFVEVKTRRASARTASIGSTCESPLEMLRPQQRARVRRLAAAWLSERRASRPIAREIRFDAVGVILDARDELLRLDHLEAAW
jgi:putative endonuclease